MAPVAGRHGDPISTVSFADGPYVDRDPRGGWRVRNVSSNGEIVTSIASGVITVPAADGQPSFRVRLRSTPAPAAAIEPMDRDAPLMVVADSHGEFGVVAAFLRAQGVVSEDLRWGFGRGQLVVTGDMLDRGAHQIEILWLLYKLEAEARAAGGRVHVLLGNHETMVMSGDLRYLHPRYLSVARALGSRSYAELFGPDTVLGAWLRSKPAMLKLGDLLLLHGGVSPELTASDLSLDTINRIVRASLVARMAEPDELTKLVLEDNGPFWYRGYFTRGDQPPSATAADIDQSLIRFHAKRILVGHTIVERVTPLYDGKVIAVHVYPCIDGNGRPNFEGAMLSGGVWYRATAQGNRIPLGLIN